MTIWEMVYAFDLKLQTVSDKFKIEERPDTDTILSFLNLGQMKMFNERYLNRGSFKENSEHLKRLANDELINLVQDTGAITIASASSTKPWFTTDDGKIYSYSTAIPQYAHYIDSHSLISRTQPKTVTSKWVINDPANSLEDMKKVETNWYNKPILRNPLVYLDGSGSLTATDNFDVYILGDAYTTFTGTSGFQMRYLRRPKALALTFASSSNETTVCELAEFLHESIIEAGFELFKQEKFLLVPKE